MDTFRKVAIMPKSYWGEIPKDPKLPVPDVTDEIEKSMLKFCLSDYEDDTDFIKNENVILPSMDPLMMYGIALHKYTNYMIEMIRVAELAIEMNVIPSKDAAPPIPERPVIPVLHRKNSLNYLPKELAPFSYGQVSNIPELSEVIVKEILRKCIITMLAHVGFETTHQSILDLLFDVLESFYEKFCQKIIEGLDDEKKGYNSGFPHVIERVLVEIGMGGIKGLHEYYQCRNIKYLDVLEKRCRNLNDHYAKLLVPKNEPLMDRSSKVIRVKEETDDDVIENDNPELHFISFVGENSILESGLHLLNSLEAEQNLQSLEEGTDDTATESPVVSTLSSEGDMCNLMNFPKNKRFK